MSRRLIELYGDPGTGDKPDPKWVKANIVSCGGGGQARLPPMPGVPPHFWFSVHRLVEPRMRKAFAAAQKAAPKYVIKRAGCFVYRHQRWDTQARAEAEGRSILPLSDHSWGSAVDIDAPTNGARAYDHGGPPPWSPGWMKVWPDGLPQAFVEAFEGEGFEWGGRWPKFRDPQHFQVR